MKAYSNALRKLWTGRCTVHVQRQVINEENGRSESAELVTIRDAPCRISGRYVPTLCKSLKKGWVDGQYFLTISEEKLKTMTPAINANWKLCSRKEVFNV